MHQIIKRSKMSEVLYQIKTDQRSYRLVARGCENAKTRAGILTTLIGEIDGKIKGTDKTATDELVLATIKKFIKNMDECISTQDVPTTNKIAMERETLEKYLPQQLTDQELTTIIKEYVCGYDLQGDGPYMGDVMAYLKRNHAGLYDGRAASTIAREML